MWQRNKKEARYTVDAIGMDGTFGNLFFSQSLHQKFNNRGFEFRSDENESAIVKYSRRLIANQDTQRN